jgi:triosephosphate isomerase (TIM)
MLSTKIPFKSTVIVRVDYNIPSLNDTYRIQITKKLILELLEEGYKVVLLTHYGRPKDGQKEKKFSTKNLIQPIKNVLGKQAIFLDQYDPLKGFEVLAKEIEQSQANLFMLENTRFDLREQSLETKIKYELAKQYATLGSYFIDEAFSVLHRQEATNYYIKKFIPWAYGYRYLIEVENLEKLKHLNQDQRPFVLVMGGSKLETKLPVINQLIDKVDKLLIGGQLAFTFIEAQKQLVANNLSSDMPVPIFDSLVEQAFISQAKELLSKYGEKIVLPVDMVYYYKDAKVLAGDVGGISVQMFIKELKKAKTIFWNGPLGQIEVKPYDQSTISLLKSISESNAFSVIGGGDTETMITPEIREKISFVSSGGGACLEYLGKI